MGRGDIMELCLGKTVASGKHINGIINGFLMDINGIINGLLMGYPLVNIHIANWKMAQSK